MSARSFSTSVGTQVEAGLSATALIDAETTEGELMSKMLSAKLGLFLQGERRGSGKHHPDTGWQSLQKQLSQN